MQHNRIFFFSITTICLSSVCTYVCVCTHVWCACGERRTDCRSSSSPCTVKVRGSQLSLSDSVASIFTCRAISPDKNFVFVVKKTKLIDFFKPNYFLSLPPFLPLLIFLFFCLLSYASPYSWLMLNSRASHLSLLRAKITGVSHATWLLFLSPL